MKRFSVKVNGQVYDVEVTECVPGAPAARTAAPAVTPTYVAPTAPVAPAVTGPVHPQPTTYTPSVKPRTTSPAIERLMRKAEAKEETTTPVASSGAGVTVKAPMPGKITFISAKVGEPVNKGDELMVLEAMKMGNTITAPVSGIVKSITVTEGQTVQGRQTLCTIE